MQGNDYKKSAQWMSEYLKRISTFRSTEVKPVSQHFKTQYLNQHVNSTDEEIKTQIKRNVLFSDRMKLNNKIENLNKI